METKTDRRDDGTIVLSITVPWKDVEKVREEVVNTLVAQVEVPGFRKGKAPRAVAEQKLRKELVQEEVLKKVLTDSYNEAIKSQNITPIISPRIHVETFEDGTNLTFTAETCEEPKIDLKNYKDEVKTITAKTKIVVPGKEEAKPNLDEIVEAVVKASTVAIPKILIDQEANRLLTQLLDELKKLGLSVDEYLARKNKTSEQLRAEYEEKAEKDLKLEFILRKIADDEKITVEKKDIDEVISGIKEEEQKKNLLQNPYFLAAIIRQQKTLDFLSKL